MAHKSKITNTLGPSQVMPAFQVNGYGIFQWSPGAVGEGIPPTAVVLQIEIAEFPLPLALRFKSRAAADEFLLAFQHHVNEVWPQENVENQIEKEK